jgi:hypothetical protein
MAVGLQTPEWRRAGVCLTNGVHTPGAEWERECPVLRAEARAREAFRTVTEDLPGRVVAPPASEGSSARMIPGISSTVFRHGRAHQPGRPAVSLEAQRQRARDRTRAYRARRRTEQTVPAPA